MRGRVLAWLVWGTWLLLGIGLIAGGLQQVVRQAGGTPAEATVAACDAESGRVSCGGTWVVGGSLAGGGRVVVGTIEGAGPGDIGTTIAVRLASDGETAFVPSPALPVALVGIGILMLATTGLVFARGGSWRGGRAGGDAPRFRTIAPGPGSASGRWTRHGRLAGLGLALRRPATLLLVLAVPAAFIGLAAIGSSQERGPLVLLGVLFSVLVLGVAANAAAADARYLAFAAREGLEYASRHMPPFGLPRTPRLVRGYEHAAATAIFRGPIGRGPVGLLVPAPTVRGYRYARAEPALALYELEGGGGMLAGCSFAVRVQDGAAAVDSERDAEAARAFLDEPFAAWLATDGPAALEVSDGWLFVQAATPDRGDDAGLEAFARRAARVAAHVAEPAAGARSAPAPSGEAAGGARSAPAPEPASRPPAAFAGVPPGPDQDGAAPPWRP